MSAMKVPIAMSMPRHCVQYRIRSIARVACASGIPQTGHDSVDASPSRRIPSSSLSGKYMLLQ